MLKKEIRIVGFDDSPFQKGQRSPIPVIGIIFRGGNFLDGVISTTIEVDGDDATDHIISLVQSTKFRPQLQAIFLNGIAVGGFNVIDIEKLYHETVVPVIVVMRKMPDMEKIKKALSQLNKKEGIALIDKAGLPQRAGKLYVQFKGITLQDAVDMLRITCTRADIPEPLRVAHLIAQGITFGESKGKA